MRLSPVEMPHALAFALRLTEVSRWGIVSTSRQQSVAEHSYRVVLIATALYDYVQNGTSHNTMERGEIVSLAMMHDLFEVQSGDLNALFKQALKTNHPTIYDETVADMSRTPATSKLHAMVEGLERAAHGTIVEVFVKIADLMEAVLYVRTYGTNQDVTTRVSASLQQNLYSYVLTAQRLNPRYEWARVCMFIDGILNPPATPWPQVPDWQTLEGQFVSNNGSPGETRGS